MAPESITAAEGDQDAPPDLRILHFNDVYHVEPGSRDPVGGITRFQTLCNSYRSDPSFKGQPDVLTFFSGDAYNPSLESSVTKGSHMVPVLNRLHTDVACVGNHDLDMGVPQFEHLASQCNFPWLLANVFDPAVSDTIPLANCKKTHMVTASNGIKIGLIGLAEREWLATVNALPKNLIFKSASETAKELVPQLRAQGAELIVALCHQREVNDIRLAHEVPFGLIDIILGGHDHEYRYKLVNGVHVLCSGTDFKQLSYIEARRKAEGEKRWDFTIKRRDITKDIVEDAETAAMIETMFSSMNKKLEKSIGYTAAPLDARFTTVRKKESNIGNFVCDILRGYYQGDCCIIAGGTIRGDQIYPPGVLRLKDIMDCFPFEDPTVVVRVKGQAILDTLENGVRLYPALEGRFPQVSNITFTFDPSQPPGDRIVDVTLGGKPLDLGREYTLVTRNYMVEGGDGFEALILEEKGGTAVSIVDDENGMLISLLLRQYFMSLKVLGLWKNWHVEMGRHWGVVQDGVHASHPVREPVNPDDHAAVAELGVLSTDDNSAKGKSAKKGVPSLVRKALRGEDSAGQKHKQPKDDDDDDDDDARLSDSEDDESHVPAVAIEPTERERQLILMRKVTRKWWRLTGLKGHPSMCAEQGEDFGVYWTRGICPKLEGRIKIVGVGA